VFAQDQLRIAFECLDAMEHGELGDREEWFDAFQSREAVVNAAAEFLRYRGLASIVDEVVMSDSAAANG
jgi:hypothetical protein